MYVIMGFQHVFFLNKNLRFQIPTQAVQIRRFTMLGKPEIIRTTLSRGNTIEIFFCDGEPFGLFGRSSKPF